MDNQSTPAQQIHIPPTSNDIANPQTEKSNNNGLIIILVIFIIIGLLAIGIYFLLSTKKVSNIQNLVPTPSASTTVTSSASPTSITLSSNAPPSDWKTYTWGVEGLILKYPPTWKVSTETDQFGNQHLTFTNPVKITVYDTVNKQEVTDNISVRIFRYIPDETVSLATPLDYIVNLVPVTIGNYRMLSIIEHGAINDNNTSELSLSDTQTKLGKITNPSPNTFQSKTNSKYYISTEAGIFYQPPQGSGGFVTLTKTDFENLQDYTNIVNILKSISY